MPRESAKEMVPLNGLVSVSWRVWWNVSVDKQVTHVRLVRVEPDQRAAANKWLRIANAHLFSSL